MRLRRCFPTFVTLTLGILLTKVTQLEGCSKCSMCMFPTTMYDVVKHWTIFSSDPDLTLEHDSRRVRFQETFMYLTYMRGYETVHEIRFTCKKDMGGNKFWALRRLEGVGDPGQYTCIQFVFRSKNVVQLRIADPSSDTSTDICDDGLLRLMDAPLIYQGTSTFWTEPRNKDLQYNECPLKGGYVMTWTGSDGNTHCDSVQQTVKLESECSAGEGISFLNMGGETCDLPPLKHINRTHFHFCLADWTEGPFSYTILYNYYGDAYMPCLRLPSNHGDEFDAVLFLDGACRPDPDVSSLENTFTLHLKRFVSNDACSDLHPECSKIRKSQCGDVEKNICRAKCGLCGDRPWEKFEIPQFLRGEWRRDTEALGQETVQVTEKTISLPSLGSFTSIGKSECIAGRLLKNKDHSKTRWLDEGNEDLLLLSTYDNGCSPRVTNLGLYNRSDSVVSFRNGHSIPFKIDKGMDSDPHGERHLQFDSRTNMDLCSSTSQIVDIKPLGDKYQAGILDWYNMVRVEDERESAGGSEFAPCIFPENTADEWTSKRTAKMTMQTFDGDCDVIIDPRSENDHSFTVNFNYCYLRKKDAKREVYNGSFSMTFTCLGTAQDNSYDDACVFTKTTPNEIINHDYVSWVLPDYRNQIFMYYVGSCAHTTWLDITNKKRTPIASFELDNLTAGSVHLDPNIGLILSVLYVLFTNQRTM